VDEDRRVGVGVGESVGMDVTVVVSGNSVDNSTTFVGDGGAGDSVVGIGEGEGVGVPVGSGCITSLVLVVGDGGDSRLITEFASEQPETVREAMIKRQKTLCVFTPRSFLRSCSYRSQLVTSQCWDDLEIIYLGLVLPH
jgi:hypothetical protein